MKAIFCNSKFDYTAMRSDFFFFLLSITITLLLDFLKKIRKVPAVILTYLIVLIGWVFFRSETVGEAFQYCWKMFAFDFSSPGIFIPNKFYVYLLLGFLIAFSGIIGRVEKTAQEWYENVQINTLFLIGKSTVSVVLFWWCLIEIFGSEFNPFIYFKF